MSKNSNERRYSQNEANASIKSLRISPQKLNLVATMIRGKKVDLALKDLMLSRKRISNDVYKLLISAIANAEENHNLDIDDLIVREAYVGKSITMVRSRACARGRGSRIRKPFSRINIIVGTNEGRV